MMKVFEFLYYSLYRMFRLVKRVGAKDENLASSFFSILLATNTGNFLFVIRDITPRDFFAQSPSFYILIRIVYVLIVAIWYLVCKNYFLKNENYLRIISYYENKYGGQNFQVVLIGVLYTLFTFLLFIGIAMC